MVRAPEEKQENVQAIAPELDPFAGVAGGKSAFPSSLNEIQPEISANS